MSDRLTGASVEIAIENQH
ncbi:hypothetical protein SCARD494_07138 [Seiridium cardinale]